MIIDTLMCDILKVDKLYAMFQFRREISELCNRNVSSAELLRSNQTGMKFCYQILALTSRSFSFVIQMLPQPLRDTICIYYLILRGLDTIEDDMEYKDSDRKLDLLESFHMIIDNDPKFQTSEFGTGDEKVLLENFAIVTDEYRKLDEAYRKVIRATAQEMGGGMAHFCGSKITAMDTKEMYYRYTRFVAGILGDGLTQLFVISGIENKKDLDGLQEESNSMGLFLQKTNIIKDFSEDFNEKRTWWPKEIWSKHGPSLAWFHEHPDNPKSVDCLNEMVCDALVHLPHVVRYLSRLSDPAVFRFCAVPQLMALCNLGCLFGDPAVFRRKLKIARGDTALIFTRAHCFADFQRLAGGLALELSKKLATALARKGAEGAGAEEPLRAALETIWALQREGAAKGGRGLRTGRCEWRLYCDVAEVVALLAVGCYKAAG